MEKKRSAAYLMKLITESIRSAADAKLKQHNLTWSQSKLLIYLLDRGGERREASQKELEEFLGVSHPTVVGIVSRMEQKGYVSCRTDKLDRRNKIVGATDKALELGAQLGEAVREQERLMYEGFSESDSARFNEYLLRLYRNLNRKSGD